LPLIDDRSIRALTAERAAAIFSFFDSNHHHLPQIPSSRATK
jgi:hypothetical protein